MYEVDDGKDTLRRYLQETREALLWKLDGLDERALRWPRTPTGTNLLGIVKHCANVEVGYFGPTFGRSWVDLEVPGYVPFSAYDEDPQADWWVDADTPSAAIIDFYRDVWTFSDQTIATLPLEARGRVPWWPVEVNQVTLHRVLVHVLTDLARHVGHADILREGIDSAAGLRPANSNLPADVDWSAYVTRLEGVAERAKGPGDR